MQRRQLFFVLSIFCTIHASQLTTPWYYSNIHNNYPDELSFCIVDLKFDGEKIKICEFGQGLGSTFRGYDALYGQGQMWSKFWNVLKQVQKTPWFLNTRGIRKEFAPEVFKEIGGRNVRSLEGIKPSSSAFVLIAGNAKKNRFSCAEFKQRYPQCLILDEVTKKFVTNKYETGLLFNDHELEGYKPRYRIFPKEYSFTVALEILHILNSNHIVLKPVNASLGSGIVMVEPQELDHALRIICRKEDGAKDQGDQTSFAYWAQDHEKFFIVEEFVASKKIFVDHKPYDPTMRVAFVLCNNAGTPSINFLDAYWKLPAKSLDDCGSFTELHKSHVEIGKKCSASVDAGDFEAVKAQLCLLLPQIYLKMLAKSWDDKQEPIS
ncbi:MAG: hypothetical protein WCW33_02030 [Candidatus Babeliales bacterium]|jgi:hypothetical protein